MSSNKPTENTQNQDQHLLDLANQLDGTVVDQSEDKTLDHKLSSEIFSKYIQELQENENELDYEEYFTSRVKFRRIFK